MQKWESLYFFFLGGNNYWYFLGSLPKWQPASPLRKEKLMDGRIQNISASVLLLNYFYYIDWFCFRRQDIFLCIIVNCIPLSHIILVFLAVKQVEYTLHPNFHEVGVSASSLQPWTLPQSESLLHDFSIYSNISLTLIIITGRHHSVQCHTSISLMWSTHREEENVFSLYCTAF